ncbi:MAG: peroxiredoxin [Gammaproteobacteria bacterium]|jgi:peroxiredoxin|nr:peroxiredoxin [Gammaproteobacteria bacterium]
MTISVGDKMPAGTFGIMTSSGPGSITTDELFNGKRVVLFSVPGAFTPTCSQQHLPGYVEKAATLKGNGIDTIACTAVNDVFVMDAWGKEHGAGDAVLMLADGNADYVSALGLELDASGFGMGKRGQRFSIIVNDGVVEQLNVEAPGEFNVSSCEFAIQQTAA